MDITMKMNIPEERLSDILCCALEGGSNYWYTISNFVEPKELKFRTSKEHVFRHLDYPLNEGGALIIEDKEGGEGTEFKLDLSAIKQGLVVMMEKYPRHWAAFQAENEDAETGDVFLQCCLFKELVYG